MFANSLAGVVGLRGKSMTLRRVTSQSYSTATGTVTQGTTDATFTGSRRRIRNSDRRRLGKELIEGAEQLVWAPVTSFASGVVPGVRDRVVDGSTTWEILAVGTVESKATAVSYVMQVVRR